MSAIIAAIIAGATSSGVTGIILYLIKRHDEKTDKQDAEQTSTQKLVLGLAYDKLMERLTMIVSRGSTSVDEYHDMKKYLYDPYIACGGDGTVEKLWKEYEKLPMKGETA